MALLSIASIRIAKTHVSDFQRTNTLRVEPEASAFCAAVPRDGNKNENAKRER
jgi:hypothetical protein